eukprot:2759867-Ditylum_brightwellii.AAC.1
MPPRPTSDENKVSVENVSARRGTLRWGVLDLWCCLKGRRISVVTGWCNQISSSLHPMGAIQARGAPSHNPVS